MRIFLLLLLMLGFNGIGFAGGENCGIDQTQHQIPTTAMVCYDIKGTRIVQGCPGQTCSQFSLLTKSQYDDFLDSENSLCTLQDDTLTRNPQGAQFRTDGSAHMYVMLECTISGVYFSATVLCDVSGGPKFVTFNSAIRQIYNDKLRNANDLRSCVREGKIALASTPADQSDNGAK